MRARLLVVVFVAIIVGVAGVVGNALLNDSAPLVSTSLGGLADPLAPVSPNDTAKQTFTVAPGAAASTIGDELQRHGLVRSGLAFRLLVQQTGVGDKLTAGDYELSPSMSAREIMEVLVRGQVKRGLVVTIPEGWRAEQIADRLEATGVTGRDDFLRAVADPSGVAGSGGLGAPPPQTLEGELFPATYEVKEPVSGAQAAELMVRLFDQRVGDALRQGAAASGLPARDLLTLASIVEREAQVPSERPTIASVYVNRLRRGMRLQADPSVQYAVATRDGRDARSYDYWKVSLSDADLHVDSPFNTYLRAGLPPGPICSPGEASIRAVLDPASTDYLYFVAKTDGSGSHLFARTLEEHNANVRAVGR